MSHAEQQRPNWNWSCNRCGTPVRLRGEGAVLCGGCGGRLSIYQDRATGELMAPEATAVTDDAFRPAEGSVCATHGDQPAIGTCDRCGDFACAGCTRFKEGRLYCLGCLQRMLLQEERRRWRWSFAVFMVLALMALSPALLRVVEIARGLLR